jgi:hypothetical protein
MPTLRAKLATRLIFVVLVTAVVSSVPHPAPAQTQAPAAPSTAHSAPPSQFASIADQVAATLTHAKAKHVAVFDFVYPYSPEWDRVGQQLAADFRQSLDATPHKFTQVDCAEILDWMKRDSIDQDAFAFSSVGIYTSRDAQVDGWVFAGLEPNVAGVRLTFNVCTGKKGGSVKSFTATIPRTPELSALIDHPPPSPDPFAGYPAHVTRTEIRSPCAKPWK